MKLPALSHPFLFILLSRKSQRPRLIIIFLRSDFRFLKDFHLLQFMITSAHSSIHFTSAPLKKYPRILISFNL